MKGSVLVGIGDWLKRIKFNAKKMIIRMMIPMSIASSHFFTNLLYHYRFRHNITQGVINGVKESFNL